MSKPAILAQNLKSFIARIEQLEIEKAAIIADVKSVYDEAHGSGLDVKTIRRVIRERRADKATREAGQYLFDQYWGALEGSPLAEAAEARAA